MPLHELKDWLNYFELFWENKLGALKIFVESDEPPQEAVLEETDPKQP